MHIRSHIQAFKAQWIIKYVDPRDAPWKDALDHWILPAASDEIEWATKLGRGVVLARDGLRRAELIPEHSVYIRECFAAFADLGIKQDTTITDHRIQGEPLCRNNRFDVQGVNYDAEWQLAKHLQTIFVDSPILCSIRARCSTSTSGHNTRETQRQTSQRTGGATDCGT